MAIEVILREDVPNLGHVGDVVRVRPGYARNYLLPRGLAIEANRKNLRVLEHQKRVVAARAAKDRKDAEARARALEGLELVVHARAGDDGRLFGSVTNLDLERLLAARGFSVDRRKILLDEPIKQLGRHEVAVSLARDLRVTIAVRVEAEGSERASG